MTRVGITVGCVVLLALAGVVLGQSYDRCDRAFPIPYVGFEMDSTTSGKIISNYTCDLYNMFSSSQGMYFVFTSATARWLTVSLCQGTSWDTILYIFTGCTSGKANTCVTFNEDYCGWQSQITWEAAEMTPYYIFVTGFQGAAGFFTITLTDADPPDNEFCTSAISIPQIPWSSGGNTKAAGYSNVSCRTGVTQAAGLWYTYSGNGSDIKAYTCKYSSIDTIVELYRGCPGTCSDWNDDSCDTGSELVWTATKGVTWYILVTSFNNIRGDFMLFVDYAGSPDHHSCSDAIRITELPFIESDTNDDIPTTRGSCIDDEERHTLWYVVHGTGQQLAAWTCMTNNYVFDTLIEIYDGCGASLPVGCISYNDDYCGVHSKVSWVSNDETDYYIGVSGFRADVNGGNFTLSVDAVEDAVNTVCWQATQITALPYDSSESTYSTSISVGGCGVEGNRFGKWFEVKLSGTVSKNVKATVCNNETTSSVLMEVYESCSMSQCIATSEEKTCNGKGIVEWVAVAQKSYFVFVTTPDTSYAFFHIDFYEDEPNEYSRCDTPYPITLPYSYTGETVTSVASYSPCQNAVKQGMWFSVIGTGNKIAAHTCSENTDYDTYISIIQACTNVTGNCIASNDDATGTTVCGQSQSRVTWVSVAGNLYYILVSGYGSATGIFQLTVLEETPSVNDDCTGAIDLSTQIYPYTAFGSNLYSIPSGGDCDVGSTTKGIWYKISGSSQTLRIDTCRTETTFDTEYEFYSGCDAATGLGTGCISTIIDDEYCVGLEAADRASSTFTTSKDANVYYWLFISGYDGAQGMAAVRVTDLTEESSSNPKDPGLSAGAKAGIVFAVFGGVAALGAAGFAGWWYYKKYYHPYQQIPDTH
ncbi:hypothetical protein Pelo_14586 [Pelomyxa schiedti]|nr:hypothetical protein Pelo_14586 [Pelomyxa schiedti]